MHLPPEDRSASARENAQGNECILRPLLRFLRAGDWGIQLPIFWVAAGAYGLTANGPLPDFWAQLARVSAIQVPLIAGIYVMNDFFDWETDRAKRPAKIPDNRATHKLLAGIALLGGGLLLAHRLFVAPGVLAIAWLQATFGLAYSHPFFRLKERGVLGVVAASSFQRIPPFGMFCLVVFADMVMIIALLAWLFAVGLVFIVEHQVQDFEADEQAGVRTFARALGVVRAQALRRALHHLFLLSAAGVSVLILVRDLDGRSVWAATLLMVSTAVLYGVVRRYYASNDDLRAE